ncbi:MAG TPA: IS1380 family transposase [Streptosporangiaceae bacterium]|nr:IS1380 family transposase [Streptosporangiaceae bacterium]
MQLSHDPLRISATFDDPDLVSRGGLVPVMALAERAGLQALVRRHVTIAARTGVYPDVKVGCLVAGMAAGADSIDDMDLLRHGAMPDLFGGVRAPSTLGSFLRSFTWGNVRQLEKAGRELLAELARQAPLLPGADQLAFVDIDSMQRRVYGHKKQGAAFGHTKIQGKTVLVRGLNALAATVCTPLAAPVIAGTRLRGGSANTARGAAGFAAEAIGAARAAGCTGTIVTRADSGFYNAAFIAACRRAGAYFSVTARMDPAVTAAIAAIPQDAWTAIRYPRAIWDDQLRAWISDAEIAEAPYTAFTSKKAQAVTARLIVRRVRDLTRQAAVGQGELFPAWRYHPVFTDSPFQLAPAEEQHRDHAVVEQVFADWTHGPLAHMPSGSFAANAAWTACAAITCNLLRAAGCLASRFHARARGATIRADLIDVAARLARRGRGQLTLHLPQYWHRESEWMSLFEAACGPPARAA